MGRFWVPDALMETRVSQTAKFLYVLLCRSTSPKDPWDWTHKQLAEVIGVSDRSIRRALVELDAVTMVAWDRGETGRRVNVYEALPPEQWKAQAFKRTRSPVAGDDPGPGGGPTGQERPGQPDRNNEGNRTGSQTPGSTAPGSTTPGRKQGARIARNARPMRPPRSQLLEGFDAVWEALPKVLSYGDAKVRSWAVWEARAPTREQAEQLVYELAEVDGGTWFEISVFDAVEALAVCWEALDSGVSVAEVVHDRLEASILLGGTA